MFFIDRLDLDRHLQKLRDDLESRGGISDDLRGWSWNKDSRVKPLSELKLPVSEVTHRYCPTYRDIYLKRILHIKAPPTLKTIRGIAYHEVFHEANLKVKQFIYASKIISGGELLNEYMPKLDDYVSEIINRSEKRTVKLKDEERGILKRECYVLYRYLLIQAAARIDSTLSKFKYANQESIASEVVPALSERKVDGSLVGFSKELSVDLYT